MLQRLARNELDVAATAIGISSEELRRAIDDGRTISAVAADAGVSSRQVVDAVVRDATARVDRGVAAGDVPADRARTLQRRLPHWAERFVLSTPSDARPFATRARSVSARSGTVDDAVGEVVASHQVAGREP